MIRRLLVVLLAVPVAALAQPPAAPDKNEPGSAKELRKPQEQNAKVFRELKVGLLSLAQKLERSDKAEDKDRAKTIRAALELADKANVDTQFQTLIAGLGGGSGKADDLNRLIGQKGELEKTLIEMLGLLMTDDEAARLRAEIEKLEKFLKEAEAIKAKTEINRAMTEAAKGDPTKLAKKQGDLAQQTKDLGQRMGGEKKSDGDGKAGPKPDPKAESKSEPKPGEQSAEPKADTDGEKADGKEGSPKDGEGKDGKPSDAAEPKAGEPKDDKGGEARNNGEPKAGEPKAGEPKAGEPKAGEPKPGDGKPSESPAAGKPTSGGKGDSKPSKGQSGAEARGTNAPKDGGQQQAQSKGGGQPSPPQQGQPSQPNPNPNQPQVPGRKQVQEAYPHQQNAETELNKDKRDTASKQQDQAIEKLAKAIEELKKRLKQLREEEMLKTLAALEARCNRMLALQIEVYENTKTIHSTVLKNGNQKSNAELQKAQQQADKEKEIVAEADKALKLLESEGSAVAFARVLEEVRGDMVAVQRRLEACYVDTDTQEIEQNIIAMLKDMIAALKKAQQDIQNQQNQPKPPGNNKPNQKLIDLLAELRLIRALQMQVNQRTKMYGAKSPGEQASDPIIKSELQQLSTRQAKLQEMIQKIATGANQ